MVRGALPDTFKSAIASACPVSRSHTWSWGLLGPFTRASVTPKAHTTSNLKVNARVAVAVIYRIGKINMLLMNVRRKRSVQREYIYIYILYVSTNFWKKALVATSSILVANDCMDAC